MRVVADTNVIVSAFLWGGVPRRLLDAVEAQQIELFTSRALIVELEDVLSRPKFTERLSRTRYSTAFLLACYTRLATLIAPEEPSLARQLREHPHHHRGRVLAGNKHLIYNAESDITATERPCSLVPSLP